VDTSKNTIVVGILMPGDEVPVIDRIWNEEGSVRHLVSRLGDPAGLRACYEAGPCGFELHRLLASMGVACDVVAPSLIPRRAGDRVKTDKRDASRLARLLRAGELTPVRVPTEAEEAVRDLVRVRTALLADRKRAQQRLTAMLLRHGRVWRSGSYWTQAHERWIAGQSFDEPALAVALAHYRAAPGHPPRGTGRHRGRAGTVGRPGAASRNGGAAGVLPGHRPAARPGAGRRGGPAGAGSRLREPSWASPAWCPASTPAAIKPAAAPVTKAGSAPVRTALVEAARAYRFKPAIGVTLRRRQRDAEPDTLARSWKAQRHLHSRYKTMTARGKPPAVAVTAVARELAGFVWAEMTS
jgi:transposase